MWTRAELKERAKGILRNTYWKSVIVGVILLAVGAIDSNFNLNVNLENQDISSWESVMSSLDWGMLGWATGLVGAIAGVAGIVTILIQIFLIEPLAVGCRKYYLEAGFGAPDLAHLGYGFQSNYKNIVKVRFFTGLEIILWSLLLVVPGIVKAYSFRMIPYLLAENPNMESWEAKQRSAEMMSGHKWEAFVLDLSFILWHILSGLTANVVGIFWVNPYVELTNVELYKVLSGSNRTDEQTYEETQQW